jgi:hypothetical protein
MARKKKTLSQSVVGIATTAMPQPVRKALGGRWVALLTVAAVSLLFATGVVSVRMENGRPKVTFNAKRAAEVREDVSDKAQDFRKEHVGRDTPVADFASDLGIGKKETVGDKVGDMAEGISEKFEQVGIIDRGGEEEKPGFRPFAKFKDKVDTLRR